MILVIIELIILSSVLFTDYWFLLGTPLILIPMGLIGKQTGELPICCGIGSIVAGIVMGVSMLPEHPTLVYKGIVLCTSKEWFPIILYAPFFSMVHFYMSAILLCDD